MPNLTYCKRSKTGQWEVLGTRLGSSVKWKWWVFRYAHTITTNVYTQHLKWGKYMDIGCFIPRLSPHVLQAMEPKNKSRTEVRRWRRNQTDVNRTWKESVHPASPIQLVMSLVVGCFNFVFSGLFLCLSGESSPGQSSLVQSSPVQFSSVQFSPLQSSDQWHHYFQPPQWEIHFMYLVPRKIFNHARYANTFHYKI